MPVPQGFIWIEDAVTKYHRSRSWLQVQIREGRIGYADVPGDRRTYISEADLAKLLGQVNIVPAKKEDQAG